MPADDNSSGSRPDGKDGNKLVKSTDLPLAGNPYPPKDVIQDEAPGFLEKAIASTRMAVQPFLTPVTAAYDKTSDIVSIGVAHTQSAIQDLSDNQNAVTSGLIISGSTLLGLILSRRKGLFKKTLYATTFFTASAALCYREEAKRNFEIMWVMAKKRFPELSSPYDKLSAQLPFSRKVESDEAKQPAETKSDKTE